MQGQDQTNKDRALRREQPDPYEGAEPAPKAVWVAIAGLLAFGSVYYALYAGDGTLKGGDSRTPLRTEAVAAAPKAVDGAAVYTQSCAACHQAGGEGVAGAFPPLARASWVTGDEKTAARIVLLGLQGPIEVNGQTYNGVMPAWRDTLNDAQIAAVLTHVRSSFGNEAPAVSEETVAALRKEYQSRSEPWKGGAELKQAGG